MMTGSFMGSIICFYSVNHEIVWSIAASMDVK